MEFLHEKMKAGLVLPRYAVRTQQEDVREARRYADHFMLSPAAMGTDEVQRYLLHLVQVRNVNPSTYKMVVASVRFLYQVRLERQGVAVRIPWPKVPQPLPVVLTGSEVKALLGAIRVVKYRAIAVTMYCAGLRVTGPCDLQCAHINCGQMVIHARHGKRRRCRYVMRPERLLGMLRVPGLSERANATPLFPGQRRARIVGSDTVRTAIMESADPAVPGKRVTPIVASALLCQASAGGPDGHARDAGAAGPSFDSDDGTAYPGQHPIDRAGAETVGRAGDQKTKTAGIAGVA